MHNAEESAQDQRRSTASILHLVFKKYRCISSSFLCSYPSSSVCYEHFVPQCLAKIPAGQPETLQPHRHGASKKQRCHQMGGGERGTSRTGQSTMDKRQRTKQCFLPTEKDGKRLLTPPKTPATEETAITSCSKARFLPATRRTAATR